MDDGMRFRFWPQGARMVLLAAGILCCRAGRLMRINLWLSSSRRDFLGSQPDIHREDRQCLSPPDP